MRQQKAGSPCWISCKDGTEEILGLSCLIVSRLPVSLRNENDCLELETFPVVNFVDLLRSVLFA